MGDSRRFSAFADLIERNFAPTLAVADIAGGKGHLQAKLRKRGFGNVVSWDRRPKYAGPRRCYHFGLFDFRSAPRGYDLVVGMHPDEATDHIVMYAAKHRIPFAVCPCCVKPSATRYEGYRYEHWLQHLASLAEAARFRVTEAGLPISGRSAVLIGWPA